MIVSQPFRRYGEGIKHFIAKVYVGKVVDKFLEDNVHENVIINTYYEYPFPTVQTDKGPRSYTADVLMKIFKIGIGYSEVTGVGKSCLVCNIAVEIDGKKPGQGHSSKTNIAKDNLKDIVLTDHYFDERDNCDIVARIPLTWITGYKSKGYRSRGLIKPLTDDQINDFVFKEHGWMDVWKRFDLKRPSVSEQEWKQ